MKGTLIEEEKKKKWISTQDFRVAKTIEASLRRDLGGFVWKNYPLKKKKLAKTAANRSCRCLERSLKSLMGRTRLYRQQRFYVTAASRKRIS